jgi:predicted nucleotidyltransferase
MTLIKQFNRQANAAQHKRIEYTNVTFPESFIGLMSSLEIHGLTDNLLPPNGISEHRVWADKTPMGGLMVETVGHPHLGRPVTLIVSGPKAALDEFSSIVERQGVLYEGKEVSTPKITHEYHDELNPVLWEQSEDGYTLRPEIREALMDIAAEFVDFQKMSDLEIQDITITGSCANFNWTPNSDIDLHMLVNFARTVKQYGPLVPEYFEAKRKVWSDLHDISIKGIPVEPYMQNTAEKHHSTAIYSLADDKWLMEPSHNPPTIDDVEIKSKLKQFMSAIDDAVSSNKAGVVEALMDKIKALRKSGLEEGGEFSIGNLVFKELRRNGYFEKLAECKSKAYDRELSVEEEEWNNLL